MFLPSLHRWEKVEWRQTGISVETGPGAGRFEEREAEGAAKVVRADDARDVRQQALPDVLVHSHPPVDGDQEDVLGKGATATAGPQAIPAYMGDGTQDTQRYENA